MAAPHGRPGGRDRGLRFRGLRVRIPHLCLPALPGGRVQVVPAFTVRKEHCEQEMYTLQMAAFAAAIGSAEQTPSIYVALGNKSILDATYRSAASGLAEIVETGGMD